MDFNYEDLLTQTDRKQSHHMFSWTDKALWLLRNEGDPSECVKILEEFPVGKLDHVAASAVFCRLYQVKIILGDLYTQKCKEHLQVLDQEGVEHSMWRLIE